jgi:high-affinity K+ transport system ATPase subunit B
MVLNAFNNISRKKPSTYRQSLTNFSVTNNVMQNIVVMPDIMLNILTFDTNGQHSTWLYDKRDVAVFPLHIFAKIVLYQQYGV